jgi:hypothetical protein
MEQGGHADAPSHQQGLGVLTALRPAPLMMIVEKMP